MMDSTVEHPVRVVGGNCSLESCWKTWLFGQGVDIDCVEIIATIFTSFDLVGLILIGFGG